MPTSHYKSLCQWQPISKTKEPPHARLEETFKNRNGFFFASLALDLTEHLRSED
jgi:hypothetical protein